MIIKNIILNNFRQFKDNCKIDFSTDKNQNVTIVMGDNGSGKTTLEQAFTWCLFDKNKFNIQDILNKEIEKELGWNNKEAIVSVTLNIENFDFKYKIKRSQKYYWEDGKIISDKSEVNVEKINPNGDYNKISKEKILPEIKKIMMPSLSEFFFFDGEHLTKMSEELFDKKRSNNFKNAVRGLVGLTALENAVKHFGKGAGRLSTVINTFNKEIDDNGSDELIDITKEINRLTSIIGAKDKEIASANEAIRILEKEKINVTIELEKMNDDIERKNKYEALNALIGKNEKEIDNQIKILFKRFGSGIGVFCSLNFFKEALEELKSFDMLDKGVPGIHSDTVKFLLKRNICICGEKITDKESRARHLNELMMALPPYSIGNSISHFATEISGIVTAFGDFEAELTNSIKRINELEKQIDDANNECREIENSLADTDKVNILRTRKENAERNINNEKNKANSAQIDKIHFEHELNEEVNKRNNLINQDKRNEQNRIYLAYAQEIFNNLLDIYEDKENGVRDDLENAINNIFEEIYDGAIEINISKNYSITTKVKNDIFGDDELERNTAQNYAIIFAFIAAIIKLTKDKHNLNSNIKNNDDKESYPLVMDAPLSSFDMTRIERICSTLPQISEQFILFIKDTDGKIAEKYLQNKIGARYVLAVDRPTVTRIERY